MASDKTNPPGAHVDLGGGSASIFGSPTLVAIYVGGTGNVIATMSGVEVTYSAVPVGTTIKGQFTNVSASSTATLMIGQFEG